MADLADILPNFDLKPWRHLIFSLEKKGVLTAELITLDPVEIVKRCPLPPREVQRMAAAVTEALHSHLGYTSMRPILKPQAMDKEADRPFKRQRREEQPVFRPQYVKTLDPSIDEALGGGFPTGSITEIVGESAVGKTQFVLSLLLSAQLVPPQGLGRAVFYLSTEASLNTIRLVQILDSHPIYQALPKDERPSLDRILTVDAHDLESQERVIRYQFPEMIKNYNIGLLVLDSVAANYRVEFQGSSRKVLADRAVSLVRMGNTLRRLAIKNNVAVVVTNQVADRFDDAKIIADKFRLSSQIPPSSAASVTLDRKTDPATLPATQSNLPSSSARPGPRKDEIMSLDFQQCFFTGWGDSPHLMSESQKTPALGLTWANQLDARIVLKIDHRNTHIASSTGNIWSDTKRQRSLAVVFAAWTASRPPVRYTLETNGPVTTLKNDDAKEAEQVENAELLDPRYWDIDDAEFP